MNDAIDGSCERNAEETLAAEIADEALEAAADMAAPINRSSVLATFNDPSLLCC